MPDAQYKWLPSKEKSGFIWEWKFINAHELYTIYRLSRLTIGSNVWTITINGKQYNGENVDTLKKLAEHMHKARGTSWIRGQCGRSQDR